MNALEQLLLDDLNHLIDRMAATTRAGLVTDCAERRPDLLAQLAESETRLTIARQSLLEGYAAWRATLEECGDLWALADLATSPGASAERRAA
jgi:hypothetical protein